MAIAKILVCLGFARVQLDYDWQTGIAHLDQWLYMRDNIAGDAALDQLAINVVGFINYLTKLGLEPKYELS